MIAGRIRVCTGDVAEIRDSVKNVTECHICVRTPVASLPMSGTGLRERKKEATTERLREVALALVAERGFDAVSIDDIAAAADVSKTTFYRYFETKEDVVLGKASGNLELLQAALDDQPLTVAAVEAARHAFGVMATSFQQDRAQRVLVDRLTRSTPSLAARTLAHQAAWEEVVRADVDRRDTHGEPFRRWLLAAQIMAAVRGAVSWWLAGGAERELVDLVDEALAALPSPMPSVAPRPSRRRR
jgi:AcrR family transcriptional regulator